MPILSVSQLNRYVASVFREDSHLRTVFVRGEISNYVRNFRSGHCYFSVKDEEAAVKAVMFRTNADRLRFVPENGMHVILQGNVTLYERDGSYQINVTDLQPDGIGAQALALQQRREKLAKLGYFAPERKRPLPALPEKIGIVTSQNAAALQDMLRILGRRYPLGKVKVYPAMVQGEGAPESIAAALRLAGADGCDVILMGRGGGSNEDLSAFQAEAVAEAVFQSPVPVVSAVGHETDHCIADEVADLRAPTPSAAAELAVPEMSALYSVLRSHETALKNAFLSQIQAKSSALESLTHKLAVQAPMQRIEIQCGQLSALCGRLRNAAEKCIAEAEYRFAVTAGRLETVSPLASLARGYALVYHGDALVRQADSLHPDDVLHIQLAEGAVQAKVTGILPQNTGETS